MDLQRLAVEGEKPIWQATLDYEVQVSGKSKEEIICEMLSRFEVMKNAAKKGVLEETFTKSGMVRGSAKKFFEKTTPKNAFIGPVLQRAVAYALAVSEVNASMGVIVAAPTAGSCGILPGAMLSLYEQTGCDERKIANALLSASGIGLFIAEKATFAAAVAGCAAEIGSSAAMTATAITEFRGGSANQAINAAAISLKSTIGLVCDPVAGLVEVPCIKRNAIGVANAFTSSEMAIAGIESAIPFPEVVDAMYRVGKRLPSELRETSKGGLAATPTALKIMGKLYSVSD